MCLALTAGRLRQIRVESDYRWKSWWKSRSIEKHIVPTLPIDHPDPFAATLATIHYPAAAEQAQRQTLIDCLMPLIAVHRQSSQTIVFDQLMGHATRIVGGDLADLGERVFEVTAVGEVAKTLLVLSWRQGRAASWANAYAIASRHAGPIVKRRASIAYLKMQCGRFKTVAHLCAALCLRELKFEPEPLVGYGLDEDFHSFLAEAEWVRYWGLYWNRPTPKASPPFAGTDMWEPPAFWRPLPRKTGWPLTGGMADLGLDPSMTGRLKVPGPPRKRATVNPLQRPLAPL